MKIQDILKPEYILTQVHERDKWEALSRIARHLSRVHDLPSADDVVEKIVAREAEISTGIGYGIAIPHARMDSIGRMCMVAARSPLGIEFNAIDDAPVFLIFMLLSPAQAITEHMEVLGTLSKIMSHDEIRERLIACDNAQTFMEILGYAENRYSDRTGGIGGHGALNG